MKAEINWIPVERKLPPPGVDIEVATKDGRIEHARVTSRHCWLFWNINGLLVPIEGATHWSFKPKHPKDLEDIKCDYCDGVGGNGDDVCPACEGRGMTHPAQLEDEG